VDLKFVKLTCGRDLKWCLANINIPPNENSPLGLIESTNFLKRNFESEIAIIMFTKASEWLYPKYRHLEIRHAFLEKNPDLGHAMIVSELQKYHNFTAFYDEDDNIFYPQFYPTIRSSYNEIADKNHSGQRLVNYYRNPTQTYPTTNLTTRFLYCIPKEDTQHTSIGALFRPMDNPTWYCLVAIILSLGIPRITKELLAKQKTVVLKVINFLLRCFLVSYENSGLMLLWSLLCIVILNGYTGEVGSFLIIPRSAAYLETLKELYDAGYSPVIEDAALKALKRTAKHADLSVSLKACPFYNILTG